jgi:Ulp1 family protease
LPRRSNLSLKIDATTTYFYSALRYSILPIVYRFILLVSSRSNGPEHVKRWISADHLFSQQYFLIPVHVNNK